MTEFPNPPSAPRSRRGLRVALVLSLMVNVLLIGVMAGGVMRFARFEPPISAQPDFRSLWRALPGEARNELRAMSREHRFPGEHGPRGSREDRRARAEAMNVRIMEMLRAEPFDRDAFAALLGGERDAMARRMEAAQTAFTDRVAALSHDERVEMAERLQSSWEHRPRH